MQLCGRYFDEETGACPSSPSVRSRHKNLALYFSCPRSSTNYPGKRIVVVQTGLTISRGTMRIARMVRSSLSTGIRRSATTCSRVPTRRHSTETCTTSTTGRKTTFSKTRPTRWRRPLRTILRPRLAHLHLIRLVVSLPNPPPPPRLPRLPRLRLQWICTPLSPIHIRIHRTPRGSPLQRQSRRQPQIPVTTMRTFISTTGTTGTTGTMVNAAVITTNARPSKSHRSPFFFLALLFDATSSFFFKKKSGSREAYRSWDDFRNSERAEDQALRRAWGAHRRRTVDKLT
jgi:hypothetical protein